MGELDKFCKEMFSFRNGNYAEVMKVLDFLIGFEFGNSQQLKVKWRTVRKVLNWPNAWRDCF